MHLTTFLAAAAFAALANAHGYITSPKARQPGAAYQKTCGMQAYYQMSGDINGNVQGLMNTVKGQSDYNAAECHLWKCKGMRYSDNVANVQTYKPGQTVPITFHIQAPHTGYANVSIIDIGPANGAIVAPNLKKWDSYASNSAPTDPSQENFSITIPSNLGSKCAKKGVCAIQFFWNAESINQTYESCIDIVVPAGSAKRHARDIGLAEESEVLEGTVEE